MIGLDVNSCGYTNENGLTYIILLIAVIMWNNLPEIVVATTTVSMFKNSLAAFYYVDLVVTFLPCNNDY